MGLPEISDEKEDSISMSSTTFTDVAT